METHIHTPKRDKHRRNTHQQYTQNVAAALRKEVKTEIVAINPSTPKANQRYQRYISLSYALSLSLSLFDCVPFPLLPSGKMLGPRFGWLIIFPTILPLAKKAEEGSGWTWQGHTRVAIYELWSTHYVSLSLTLIRALCLFLFPIFFDNFDLRKMEAIHQAKERAHRWGGEIWKIPPPYPCIICVPRGRGVAAGRRRRPRRWLFGADCFHKLSRHIFWHGIFTARSWAWYLCLFVSV